MNIPSLLIISTSFDVMILVVHPVACADDEFLSDDAWSLMSELNGDGWQGGAPIFFTNNDGGDDNDGQQSID